jgi:anti-sigma factor RsiW
LGAYLDTELDLVRSLEVERHLADCPACAAELSGLESLRVAIQAAPLRHAPPRGLEGRVRTSLRRAGTPRRHRVVLVAAAALLLAAAGTLAFGIAHLRSRPAADPLAREVAEAHIRSLQVEHRTDVASSDRHTVKPWFVGKLDYAPPVLDLSAAGYQLVGGRLDYVDDRPVSALVYQRRQHLINVFVWPSAPGAEADLTPLEQKGYNLIHWEHGGMTWWAVSDLNATELRSFVCQVRESLPPAP